MLWKSKKKIHFQFFFPGSTFTPPTSPVAQLQIGETTLPTIPPKSFWRSKFTQDESKFVKFNMSIEDDAVLGVYGRRGVAPSVAQFDFFEVVDGRTLSARSKRSTKVGNSRISVKMK